MRLTRRLLPLYIAAFSQGLVLWAPIEKVFLRSLGFDQAALGLMAACYSSLIPLLDLFSGILADRWSRKGVLMLASIAAMLNALLGGLSHDVPTYLVSTLFKIILEMGRRLSCIQSSIEKGFQISERRYRCLNSL
jgi:MFS family permease